MCYSKEVSLVVGSVIASGCGYSWWKYVWKSTRGRLKKLFTSKRLVLFFKYVLIGYFCIAGHQFMEFLAIQTESQVLYKIGLIVSISCMYFLMRSLEVLSRLSLGSRVFAFVIIWVGIIMFGTNMSFENMHFWVRGYSHFIWAAAWMLLFIYWNVCIWYIMKISTVRENRRLLLLYGFCVVNLSFVVALIYAYFSAYVQGVGLFCSSNIFTSFNVVKDSPSIWCVFAGIQVLFIPFLFSKMKKGYVVKMPLLESSVSKKTSFMLVWLTVAIWLILFLFLPMIFGVGLKMITH